MVQYSSRCASGVHRPAGDNAREEAGEREQLGIGVHDRIPGASNPGGPHRIPVTPNGVRSPRADVNGRVKFRRTPLTWRRTARGAVELLTRRHGPDDVTGAKCAL